MRLCHDTNTLWDLHISGPMVAAELRSNGKACLDPAPVAPNSHNLVISTPSPLVETTEVTPVATSKFGPRHSQAGGCIEATCMDVKCMPAGTPLTPTLVATPTEAPVNKSEVIDLTYTGEFAPEKARLKEKPVMNTLRGICISTTSFTEHCKCNSNTSGLPFTAAPTTDPIPMSESGPFSATGAFPTGS